MSRRGPSLSTPWLRLPALVLLVLTVLVGTWSAGSPADAADPEAPGKPANLGVTTEPGSLRVSLDWDDVDGAAQYLVRWREAGVGNELNAGYSTAVSWLKFSVAGYGQWVVRVQACNDAGCGKPQTRKFRVEPAPEPETNTPAESTSEPDSQPAPPPALDVSISASPASPEVNQYATMSAIISNIPFDSGWPSYNWQMQQGGGWNSVWTGPTFSYNSNAPVSVTFRLTVSYETGISDTSDPLTVTWTGDPPPVAVDPVPEPVIETLEVATADCELAPPEGVTALGVAKAAVAFWQAPSGDDACEPVGYLFEARNVNGGPWRSDFVRAEARSHVLEDLPPGQVEYHVTTIYPTGASDRPLALPQVSVPLACDITLTVGADVDSGISGTWTNVAGSPSGCVFGPEIEFQFKQSNWDHFRSYGRYPNSQQTGQNQDSFIAYDLTPGVSYDFRIVAVDAAGRTNRSNVASATVAYDVDAADDHSPRNVRVAPFNRGNAYVAWESAASAPSGQSLVKYVVEWKTPGGEATTKDVDAAANKLTEITGLTDGSFYLVRVAAQRTDASNTIHDAWSGPAPFTARVEPLQVWFRPGLLRFVVAGNAHRLFARARLNIPAADTVCLLNDATVRQFNCPPDSLVNTDLDSSNVSIKIRSTTEGGGSVAETVDQDGDTGGGGPPQSFASGGNGTIVIEWSDAGTDGATGTQDAWEVEHVQQNADETWPAWSESHIITDLTARSHTFTGLDDGTWRVRVRARYVNTEDHDDDPNTPDQAVQRDGMSSEVHTVTVDSAWTAVPGLPTGAVIRPGVGTLVVEWEPPTGGGSEVYAYQVRHRRGDYAFGDGGGSWTQSPVIYPRQVERICETVGVVNADGEPACINPRRYAIPNLIGGRDYDVAIRARNANGWGDWLQVGEFNLPNGFPPVLQSAAVNGATLTLTFDRSLDGDSRPSASVFSVSVNGTSQVPTGVGISGSTLTLTLGTAVTSGQTVTVSYTRPGQTPLQHNDAQGPSFSDFAVTNNTP